VVREKRSKKEKTLVGLLQTVRFAFQRVRGKPSVQCTHLDQIHDVTPSSSDETLVRDPGLKGAVKRSGTG
jgi:hypothetical protein